MTAVPSVSAAALYAIKDAQTRDVLRAIVDGLAVRNGDVGNGDKAFLTRDDLTQAGYTSKAVASALARSIAANANTPGSGMLQLADQLEQRIIASPAWQSMFTRLDLIAAPESSVGSAAWSILQEAKARGAAITTVIQTIQSNAESVARQITSMTASLNDNAAAIKGEETARADAVSAVTTQLTTFIAQTANSIAGLVNDITAKTNNDNALVQAINTMWARVGLNTPLIQNGAQIVVNDIGSALTKFEQLQTVTTDPATGLVAKSAALRQDLELASSLIGGLNAKWGIKLDLNGYVTGVALNASKGNDGNTTSSFNVLADTFAVGAPGRPNSVPFAIDALTGLVAIRGDLVVRRSITADALVANTITANSGVIGNAAIGEAHIQNASITNAKIQNAAVDTLTLRGNAVTVMSTASGTDSAEIWVYTYGGPVFLAVTGSAYVGANYQNTTANGTASVGISRDGVSLISAWNEGYGNVSATTIYVDRPSGSLENPVLHVYRFGVAGHPSTAFPANSKIFGCALEAKR